VKGGGLHIPPSSGGTQAGGGANGKTPEEYLKEWKRWTGHSPAKRRARAVESFGNAAKCIGPITKGMSLFAITRGQWSMIDAILHILHEVGPSKISFWTWTVAEYEIQVVDRLRRDGNITAGRMIIDYGARNKNAQLIRQWKDTFGEDSVRYVVNHAKIATIESESGLRLLARGSMNLNFNPRFEQFDLTEGGPDFDLVRRIEDELPILPDDCTGPQAFVASKAGQAFDAETLKMFTRPKVWEK
jgi:hypothetical protein